jgi:signal transduction histidine kinase
MFRERTFGAIYIDSSIANYTFTAEQLALMNAIGQHTALALANGELAQQKLQAERLAVMGETVASLSHSIKNILQGLRGGADVVEMGLKKNDLKVATGGWAILKRNLDRIIGLTMNMLAYSRPRTLEVELAKIGPLLEDCASLLQDRAQQKGVAVIVDADADMPPIPLDPGQMHQALMNLLTNALEAVDNTSGVITAKASFIRKRGSADLGEARIEVIDNGPGIPAEMLPRIFEPFFTTKGMRGTGLGLAVTRRIVELHHGKIEVKSELSKGSTFTIRLPVDLSRTFDPSATTTDRPGPVPVPRI